MYMNKTNRKLMKELEIQAMGKLLGRPSKEAQTEEYQAEMVAVGERNEIEATFVTGKRIYRANNIRAKLPETANCWTGMCYFVKNVMEFLRELLYALIFFINLLGNPGSIWRILYLFPKFAYRVVLNG
ncbi:MAG: transposase [Odoribacter sp.]